VSICAGKGRTREIDTYLEEDEEHRVDESVVKAREEHDRLEGQHDCFPPSLSAFHPTEAERKRENVLIGVKSGLLNTSFNPGPSLTLSPLLFLSLLFNAFGSLSGNNTVVTVTTAPQIAITPNTHQFT
jgi:hypothetical protein